MRQSYDEGGMLFFERCCRAGIFGGSVGICVVNERGVGGGCYYR
jgi:hypothetical protein